MISGDPAAEIRALLENGRAISLRPLGTSMFPFIPEASAAMIEPLEPGWVPRIGDLVLVPVGQDLALHRVVGIQGSKLKVKGDWGIHPDPEVDGSQVLGRCNLLVRKGEVLNLDGRLWRIHGATLARVFCLLSIMRRWVHQAWK